MNETKIDPMEVERKISKEMDEVPVWRLGHIQAVQDHVVYSDYLLRTVSDVAQRTNDDLMSRFDDEPIDRASILDRMEAIIQLIEEYRRRSTIFVDGIEAKRRNTKKVS